MIVMFQQILTIGRNTFIESIRQPIFAVLIFVATIGLWTNTHVAGYTFGDDNKLMIDLGLSVLFLTGLALAGFSATGVITAEIQNKTVLTVVSKPVARPLFVLGKYFGVAAAIAVAFWILTVTYLVNIRHQVMETASDNIDWPVVISAFIALALAVLIAAVGNYLYHWVFTSSVVFAYMAINTLALLFVLVIDKSWQFQSIATEFTKEDSQLGQILIALLLIFEAVLVLTSVAIAVSTRLSQVMTMVVCVGVFMLGLVSNSIYHDLGASHPLAALLYWIMPNLQYLWMADALTSEHSIPMLHVAWLSGYCALYVVGMLCLSISLFQTREVG